MEDIIYAPKTLKRDSKQVVNTTNQMEDEHSGDEMKNHDAVVA